MRSMILAVACASGFGGQFVFDLATVHGVKSAVTQTVGASRDPVFTHVRLSSDGELACGEVSLKQDDGVRSRPVPFWYGLHDTVPGAKFDQGGASVDGLPAREAALPTSCRTDPAEFRWRGVDHAGAKTYLGGAVVAREPRAQRVTSTGPITG